jgi:hypothetical protein
MPETFTLRSPVKLFPASIAPHHYTIAAGRTVHLVTRHTATLLAVSLVENPADRISEDIFHVSASELEDV